MSIREGDFIKLNFTGYVSGKIFDTTDENKAREAEIYEEKGDYSPRIICVGKKQIIPGLDEDFIGKEPGSEAIIEIPPEKAYGQHERELIRSYKKKEFSKKPTLGMRVSIPEAGTGTVVNVIGDRVIIDFNYPLAGQTVTYNYKIEEIVESATEQIRGIIQNYSGHILEVHLEDSTAVVELSPGIYYVSRSWLDMKPYITSAIFDEVTGIDEIRYIELYKKPVKDSEEESVSDN
jgi:FKBP-type peptidyl-prolyl cis-trans isomerase 2